MARDTIIDVVTDEVVVRENEIITNEISKRIEGMGYEKIRARSPLTCEASLGVCARCYGMDLSRSKMVELGLAVGIIGAQSIGEPGTQLTMRTFHIGGTAHKTVEEAEIRTRFPGVIRYDKLKVVVNDKGEQVVLNRNGEIIITDEQGREVDRHLVPAGAVVKAKEGQKIKEKQILVRWDPHHIPILCERDGKVRYDEIVEGKTMKEEADAASGVRRKQIIEHKGDLHPQIVITDDNDHPLALYPIPERAYLEVKDGQTIKAGTLIAKTPREITGTQDITGGLPRVTELFEARKPKDPAVMSEIDGIVELGDKKRGKRVLRVTSDTGIGAVLVTMMWGVKRGLFSNEAGQGSAPIAHAAASMRTCSSPCSVSVGGGGTHSVSPALFSGDPQGSASPRRSYATSFPPHARRSASFSGANSARGSSTRSPNRRSNRSRY